MTRLHLSYGSSRKKPKAGDMRFLKGRQVWQIRQQVMHVLPGSGGRRVSVVSNGRPVWEWVDRSSERDREWAWTSRGAKPYHTNLREYMEQGCLCIHEGKVKIIPTETNRVAARRYLAECTCSRKQDLTFEE